MTKEQKKWFNWGFTDQKSYPSRPEAILQEAWNILLKDIDRGLESWNTLFSNFPYYRKGVEQATKKLKLDR